MSNYYVTKEDLLSELLNYKETNKPSEQFGEMLYEMATGIARKPNFSNYTWKEDMVLESVLTCLKYCRKFDTDKSTNPFGYLTMIMYRCFIAYIKKQNANSKIKDELHYHYNDISWREAIDYSKFKNKCKKTTVKLNETEYTYICPKCGCVERRKVNYDENKIDYIQAIEQDELQNKCRYCN